MTRDDLPPARHHRGAGLLALIGGIALAVGSVFGATAGVGAIWSAVSSSGSAAVAATSANESAPAQSGRAASSTSKAGTVSDATATSETTSGEGASGAAAVVPIVLQRDDTKGPAGTITDKVGWPRYAPSAITVPAGKAVTLVIADFDDAATPLPAASRSYDNVQGGTETVNGRAVTSISNTVIAHTFTVPSLGINVPIPMATDQGSGSSATVVPSIVTFTFTFTPSKSGSFTWQCYTPCGSGSAGTSGPMATPGFMRGTLTVKQV